MIAAALYEALRESVESVRGFFSSIVEFDNAMLAGDAARLDAAVSALFRR